MWKLGEKVGDLCLSMVKYGLILVRVSEEFPKMPEFNTLYQLRCFENIKLEKVVGPTMLCRIER